MTLTTNINKIKGCLAISAAAAGRGNNLLTDDTQMMLFTAEGLILSKVREEEYQQENKISEAVFHSLLRWLYTQHAELLGGMMKQYGSCSIVDGILLGHKDLFSSRTPSDTCLEALSRGTMGTIEYPVNKSCGKGALVRNLVVGCAFKENRKAFETAAACAATTHGHLQAFLSAGFLAAMVCELIQGRDMETAMENAIEPLKTYPDHKDILETIYEAKSLSMRMRPQTLNMKDFFPDSTALHILGTGLFYTLICPKDINQGLAQVQQADIPDEACAVAGGLIGAFSGIDATASHWTENLELADVILELAHDLYTHFNST